jgi:hypothetical protein
VYNNYQNKKANDRLVEERIRHNRALEGKGLYMNKKPKDLMGEGVGRNEIKTTKIGRNEIKTTKSGRNEIKTTKIGRKKLKSTKSGRNEIKTTKIGRKQTKTTGNGLLKELMLKKKTLR